MKMLHVTNGDGAADLIKACDIRGDVLPWRDPMHHGPFPQGLSLDELRPVRAKHLSGSGHTASEVERDFQLRDEHLRASQKYDRVVLWFEHDLLDQLQILQLLDWFAWVTPTQTDLHIICIDTFPGIEPFRGIGQLTVDQIASLFDRRMPVTPEMMQLAKVGWAAFRSPDPQDLVQFMSGDLRPLPFLHATLTRHLEEFPSAFNGLTRSEEQLLSLVKKGVLDPQNLFLRNMDLETAFFMGDWPTFAILDRLHKLELLVSNGEVLRYDAVSDEERAAYRHTKFSLSQKGEMALSGLLNPRSILEHDRWLGGVNFQSEHPYWAWDSGKKTLTRCEA